MIQASPPTQARRLANQIILNVEFGYISIDEGMSWFDKSYRAPIIRHRAAKRFGRQVRNGKVVEGKFDWRLNHRSPLMVEENEFQG